MTQASETITILKEDLDHLPRLYRAIAQVLQEDGEVIVTEGEHGA